MSQAPSRAAGTLPCPEQVMQTLMGGRAGVWPGCPSGCSALCPREWGLRGVARKRVEMWWTKCMGAFTRLWEALCLISRPCNDCCSSRCCGLQGLGIPCVRNVGLALEFWNLIWENPSSHQKCTMTWPAHLSLSGFECTHKGLMCMENRMCQSISGPARAGQKHGPKQKN